MTTTAPFNSPHRARPSARQRDSSRDFKHHETQISGLGPQGGLLCSKHLLPTVLVASEDSALAGGPLVYLSQ